LVLVLQGVMERVVLQRASMGGVGALRGGVKGGEEKI
jgi:hypothetical protein